MMSEKEATEIMEGERDAIYARARRVRDLNVEEGAEEEGKTIQDLLDDQDAAEEAAAAAEAEEEGIDVSELMHDETSEPDAIDADEYEEEDEVDPYAEPVAATEEEEAALEEAIGKPEESEENPEDAQINKTDEKDSGIIDIKVDGKTFNVSQKEVDDFGGVEAYQKHRSANMRLRTAATTLAQAQDSLAEIEKMLDQPASEDSTHPGETPQANAKDAVKALFSGDEEQAEAALSELVQNREAKAPAVATEQLDKLRQSVDAAQSAATLYQDDVTRQITETNAVVDEQFASIVGNPELKALMFTRFKTLQDDPSNEGRELKYLAIDAGNWVNELLNKPNSAEATTASDEPEQLEQTRQAKVEQKRKLPHQGSGGSRQPAKPAPRKRTKSDAIAAMKLARGQ